MVVTRQPFARISFALIGFGLVAVGLLLLGDELSEAREIAAGVVALAVGALNLLAGALPQPPRWLVLTTFVVDAAALVALLSAQFDPSTVELQR